MARFPHPVARILLWCGWAVAVERAAGPQLAILAVAAATAFLFAPARRQLLRLLRRTRWLMAVLLLTYAYALPGAALWPGLGWLSPTAEGLWLGALRAGRLALMLAGLAVLLAYTPRARLIYGLYALAKPLSRLGFDRRAFAVRLGLTLDYVEHAPRPARWLDALRMPPADDGVPATYPLQIEPWRSRDSAAILAGMLLLVIVLA
ncbi:MAG TPA: CbiQ family ECF transporter T component [Thiobacillaceae bacterium]|nr:CbiQ family ECF transporter T component [Thiobacillaceae bacterium]